MRTLIAAIAVLFVANTASAQWLYDETGSAFANSTTHLAFTPSGGYGLGLRCTNASDLIAIFVTTEDGDANAVHNLNSVGPELLLRIDDGDIMQFDTIVEETDSGLAFRSNVPLSVADEMSTGVRRASAAVRVLGQVFHEVNFSLQGSTAVIQQLRQGCGF